MGELCGNNFAFLRRNIVTPPLHENHPFSEILCTIVGCNYFIFLRVGRAASKTSVLNLPDSSAAVLAMDRIPWATSSPPKPIRIMAALAVCSCMWLSGALILGNTLSLCPLMTFFQSKTRKASLLSGTLWGFFIFINSAGMFHMPVSISISDHLVRTASPGRTHVRSCHSISSLVSKRIEALFRATKKRGSSEGGNAGIFCFFGLLNRCPRLSAGLNSMSSSVAA